MTRIVLILTAVFLLSPTAVHLRSAGAASAPSFAPSPQTPEVSFLGITFDESGFVLPDPSGAAGPTQFLLAVNGHIRVFDKTGLVGGLDTTLDGFFASVGSTTNAAVEPRVAYDRLSSRWFVIARSIDAPTHIYVAVSNAPTILGAVDFTFFRFDHDASALDAFTQPTLGVDANALYVGGVVESVTSHGPIGSTVFVVRKDVLLGGSLNVRAFRGLMDPSTFVGPFAPVGVSNDDPAATEGYIIGVDGAAFGLLQLRRISNPGGLTPTISANIPITIPATQLPRSVPALGAIAPLQGIDDRVTQAQIKNGSLWTAHAINVDTSGDATSAAGTTGRNGSRFYEITNLATTPTVAQFGTVFDPTSVSTGTARHYWIPSVAATGQGHMAMGFSAAAPTNSAGTELVPSVGVAGRLRSDPLGSTQAPTIAHVGTGSFNLDLNPFFAQRWGISSTTTVDPTDDMTVWTAQEYVNGDNSWAVRVIKVRAPAPAIPASANPSSASVGNTLDVTITGSSANGTGFFDPGPSFPNRLTATVNDGGITVNAVTYVNPTTVTLNISIAPGAVAGAHSVTITNPDGQSATSTAGIFTVNTDSPVATTTSISSLIEPTVLGQTATFVAHVAGASGTASGTVEFRDGGILIGGASLDGFANASISTSSLSIGSHAIQAHYLGGSGGATTFAASDSGVITHRVKATITATAGAHGSMSPSGPVTVFAGANQTFTFTADVGYQIADVLVDGASVGPIGSYTFQNISANHTISVTFGPVQPIRYQICLLYDSNVAKKSGSAYPIKIQLCDAGGNNLSSPSIVVHAVNVTQTSAIAPLAVDDTGNANPDADFRFDATLNGYVLNLSTRTYTSGTYTLNFIAGADPVTHSAPFAVK